MAKTGACPLTSGKAPDDRYLFVSCFGDNLIQQWDVTTPTIPNSSSSVSPVVQPNMMHLTIGDGQRMYVTNSLLSTLDHAGRFYVRLIHVGPDGMKVDPFFNVDLNKLPTGPARGHDMLINMTCRSDRGRGAIESRLPTCPFAKAEANAPGQTTRRARDEARLPESRSPLRVNASATLWRRLPRHVGPQSGQKGIPTRSVGNSFSANFGLRDRQTARFPCVRLDYCSYFSFFHAVPRVCRRTDLASQLLADIGLSACGRVDRCAGKPFALADLRGKAVIVSFICTTCTGSCPATTFSLDSRAAGTQGGGDSGRTRSSSSPSAWTPRDTPEVLAAYARNYNADPAAWHFLTGHPRPSGQGRGRLGNVGEDRPLGHARPSLADLPDRSPGASPRDLQPRVPQTGVRLA